MNTAPGKFRREKIITLARLYIFMPSNPKFHGERMATLTQVWSAVYPQKEFSGLSLDEVQQGFQQSFEARARLAELYAELAAALQRRKTADDHSVRLYNRAISAIRADANQDDSQMMLRAIKYVAGKSIGLAQVQSAATHNKEDAPLPDGSGNLRVIEGAA